MKRTLLLLLFAYTLNTCAQTTIQLIDYASGATIAANSTVYVKSKAVDDTKTYYDFKNTSNTTQQYKVKRYDVLLHKKDNLEAEAFYCFSGLCYGAITLVAPNAVTLTPNQSASQSGTVYLHSPVLREYASEIGLSIVKYTFFNAANSSDSVQFTIRYSDPVWLSVKDKSEFVSQTDIVPNPATSGFAVLKFTSSSAFDGKLNIINSIGQVVDQKEVEVSVGANKIQMETSGLSAGVYFVRLEGRGENVTKRLIVN